MGIWDRIFREIASMRGYGSVAIDSTTVEAKRGRHYKI